MTLQKMSDSGGDNHSVKSDIDRADSRDGTLTSKAESPQKARHHVISAVSRPPSTYLGRVDEEPSTTDGRATWSRPGSSVVPSRVETCDKGVGPTPLPPHPLGMEAEHSFHSMYPGHRLPLGLSHIAAAAPAYYGMSFPYPHVPYSINHPLPITSQTLEGRYHWPPYAGFHHPPGLPPSPAHSDMSLINLPSPVGTGEPIAHLASRIHWEQMSRNYYGSPIQGRRYSPATLAGLPLPTDFLHYPVPSQRSMFIDMPPTPGSGSITLPGSVESSRITSPRPSIIVSKTRKRALSLSPISDYLDIQSLTRSSEGSLHLTPLIPHNSRSSSAASGSYGHLSAASLGTASPAHPPFSANPFTRPHGLVGMPASPLFYPVVPGMFSGQHPMPGSSPYPGFPYDVQSSSSRSNPFMYPGHVNGPTMKVEPQSTSSTKDPSGSSVVSSTVEHATQHIQDMKKSRIKREEGLDYSEGCDEESLYKDGANGSHIPHEGEPDFIETQCHWEGCSFEFDTQDDLVRHINHEHIQVNKKLFVCRWRECCREEKPFKAQYMLVVHMRRHTGEKPHRCTFEGCMKAYSRLENLKTHLRSHTGEKPYTCEFPGCTKAFSNASDRAKHQNRTHSNAKPYVCKAPGCTKRYTDPSSLRKHVKTVHGPDFYANKKHRTNEPSSCSSEHKHDDQELDKKDDGERKVEECSSVGPMSVAGERRKSQDSVGTSGGGQSQPSPQSSPEVNVTSNEHVTDLDDHMTSGSQVTAGMLEENNISAMLEEEVDIPEPDEAEVPSGDAVVARTNRINSNRMMQNRLKGRLTGRTPNNFTTLTQLPTVNNGCKSNGNMSNPSPFTDLSNRPVNNKQTSPQHKRISDLARLESLQGTLPVPRRDSNSSTMSSNLGSMRSDASPFPGSSQFSSRRTSELSEVSARLSIINSPYEYDITGNVPNSHSRRWSNLSDASNISNVEAQFQKTSLGSHPNLDSHNHRSPGHHTSDRLARFLSTKPEHGALQTSMPCATPLADDLPGYEVRRASDPVRTVDPNVCAMKRLQRFHSLNTVKPLPVPQNMKSLLSKAGSKTTMQSSRSSIATDFSMTDDFEALAPSESALLAMETELDDNMLEDNDDIIIPDEMQMFLCERYGNTNSQQNQMLDNARVSGDYVSSNTDGNQSSNVKVQQQSFPSSPQSLNSANVAPNSANVQESVGSPYSIQSQYSPSYSHDTVQSAPPASRSSNSHVDNNNNNSNHVSANTSPHSAGKPPLPNTHMSSKMQRVQSWNQQQQQRLQHEQQHRLQLEQQQCVQLEQQRLQSEQQHSQNSAMVGQNINNTNIHMNGSSVRPHPPNIPHHSGMSHPMNVPHPPNMPRPSTTPHLAAHSSRVNQPPVVAPPAAWHQTFSGDSGNTAGHVTGQVINQNICVTPPQGSYSPIHAGMAMQQCISGDSSSKIDYSLQLQHPPHPPHISGQAQNCHSPQLQVPHISQSEIPLKAKAANRTAHLMNLKEQQAQDNMLYSNTSSNSAIGQGHPSSGNMPTRCLGGSGGYANKLYPMHIPKTNSNMPAMLANPQSVPLSSYSNMMGPPHLPAPPPQQNLSLGYNQNLLTAQNTNTNSMNVASVNTMIPQQLSNYQSQMKMSPGCNQVTSSTDRNVRTNPDAPDVPVIEDFMDNINSISSENLLENLSSVSTERLNQTMFSPNRTPSQNSSRYNPGPVLNMSNMAVNDMSSVLTQLAEENKYLNMKH